MKNKKASVGVLSLLSATFIYGFFGVLTRIIGFKLPLFYQSWIRSLFEFFTLIPFIVFLRKWVPVKKEDWKWLIIRSVTGLIGFYGSYIAFLYISFGTTYFVFYAGEVIFGYILGSLLFKEKLTRIKITSLLLAIVGLSLIYSVNFDSGKFLYALFALISGFGTATWNTVSKKISDTYSAIQLNFIDMFLCFLITLVVSLSIKETWTTPALSQTWLALALFGIMFILTGQLMVYGFNHLDVHIASLIMLTEILFGTLFGFIFFKESITFLTLIGGILIITAMILPELRLKKTNR